jgi:excisionase family DNA binding protein
VAQVATETEQALIRPAAVALRLDVSPSTVRRWVNDGLLPAVRLPGGQIRILASDLERLSSTSVQLEPA